MTGAQTTTPPDAMEICGHCSGSGVGVADTTCGRCDGSGGTPPDAAVPSGEREITMDGVAQMVCKDNQALKKAGNRLSAAASLVTQEYDGIHRMNLAIAGWANAIAGEGGRSERYGSPCAHPTPDDLAARDERVRAETLAEVERAIEDLAMLDISKGNLTSSYGIGRCLSAIRALATQPKETPDAR